MAILTECSSQDGEGAEKWERMGERLKGMTGGINIKNKRNTHGAGTMTAISSVSVQFQSCLQYGRCKMYWGVLAWCFR